MSGSVVAFRQPEHGMQTVGGNGYPPKGAAPSQVAAWADARVRRLGMVPGAERPDAILCPVCGGKGYTHDSDGAEVWCPGECRHTGVVMAPRFTCPTCQYGDGWVKGAGGDPAPCPACRTGRDQVVARLRSAMMPLAYQGYSLTSFADRGLNTGDERAAAWAAAAALSSDSAQFARLRGASGLYLFGPAGVGKTGLAAGVLNALAASSSSRCRWLAWRSWLGELRYAMRTDAPADPDMLIDLAGAVDVLVLDDIGTAGQGESGWRRDVAWRLFEARYQRHQRPGAVTIVTSNLAAEALEESLGQPVVSRILGVAVPLRVAGPDARVVEAAA